MNSCCQLSLKPRKDTLAKSFVQKMKAGELCYQRMYHRNHDYRFSSFEITSDEWKTEKGSNILLLPFRSCLHCHAVLKHLLAQKLSTIIMAANHLWCK